MLKKGNRVKLTDEHNRYEDMEFNPKWKGKFGKVKGTIAHIYGVNISVEWDNGECNCYVDEELTRLKKAKKIEYDLFGKEIRQCLK